LKEFAELTEESVKDELLEQAILNFFGKLV
jgi:hypothetical protein